MRYLPDGTQMKAADMYTIETLKVPSLTLMERAAQSCIKVLTDKRVDLSHVLVVCGSGNNGGDGFAIGRILKLMGYQVTVFLAGNPEHLSKECAFQVEKFENCGGRICNEYPEGEYSIIVDALFGVGLSRKIEGKYAEVIDKMNEAEGIKFAVDIPSGISADTGCILGIAFRADITVTFQAEKRGLLLYPGQEYSGEIVRADIGICGQLWEEDLKTVYTCDSEDYWKLLPDRKEDSNKGTYGRLLIIAGSKGMSGAAYLNAKAAYRAGAGLVRIYTHKSNRTILQTLIPEAIVTTYKKYEEEEVLKLLNWADAVCIGSGIGTTEISSQILETVLREVRVPCVIDADGINLLANYPEHQEFMKGGSFVLTPHMKEMSRLLKCSVEEIKINRFKALETYTNEKGVVCVLKDSRTLVSGKGERTYVNLSGNSVLAKAGSGDVLAGLIAGLTVQGVSIYAGAVLGVHIHGRCGDLARDDKGKFSVLASELPEYIGSVLKEQEEEKYEKLYKNLRSY